MATGEIIAATLLRVGVEWLSICRQIGSAFSSHSNYRSVAFWIVNRSAYCCGLHWPRRMGILTKMIIIHLKEKKKRFSAQVGFRFRRGKCNWMPQSWAFILNAMIGCVTVAVTCSDDDHLVRFIGFSWEAERIAPSLGKVDVGRLFLGEQTIEMMEMIQQTRTHCVSQSFGSITVGAKQQTKLIPNNNLCPREPSRWVSILWWEKWQ